jgi:hypothetical protein
MLQKPNGILTYTFVDGDSRKIIYARSDMLKWLFVLDRPNR